MSWQSSIFQFLVQFLVFFFVNAPNLLEIIIMKIIMKSILPTNKKSASFSLSYKLSRATSFNISPYWWGNMSVSFSRHVGHSMNSMSYACSRDFGRVFFVTEPLVSNVVISMVKNLSKLKFKNENDTKI